MWAILLTLFFFTSCGKTTNRYVEDSLHEFNLKVKGYYRAPLNPINSRLTRGVRGMGSFFINDIQFYAKVNLSTSWEQVTHMQMIHEGSVCPSIHDDANNDGYLDGLEALSIAGRILIPLDFDLRSQFGKFTVYPVSSTKGRYLYVQSASTVLMMEDLRKTDDKILSYIGKIKGNEEIEFKNRVLIIYGVPEYWRLPTSVKSFAGFPAYMALPIACGKIYETSEVFPF
jgi:hypothetical protein